MMDNKLLSMIMGVAIGDALGLPAQFYDRKILDKYPITEMAASEEGPAGTYSDDTAMTLCTLASLVENGWQLDLQDIMKRFIDWLGYGYMAVGNKTIDVGIATRNAIQRAYDGIPLNECGGKGEWDCGNGSLMRISPLIFYCSKHPEADILKTVSEVSALTHAHERCKMCCYVYVKLGLALLNNSCTDNKELFKKAMAALMPELKARFAENETDLLSRLYDIDEFVKLDRNSIKSSGYVIDTLEASLWCFLTTDNFKDCILKAVNLGDDADTVAAIAGALAGLHYGYGSIPKEWLNKLLGKEKIYELCR